MTRANTRGMTLFRGLNYFEAVARLGSVSAAAAEVGVSASALSHQMRALSEALGEELIVRKGRGIAVTEAGRRLSERLSGVVVDLENIVDDALGANRKVVRIAVCSSFGPAWLAPRLPQLMEAHPDLSIELRMYAEDPDQSLSVADAMVTARPTPAGYETVTLFEERLVAVGAPEAGTDLDGRALITTDLGPGKVGEEWGVFLAAKGKETSFPPPSAFLRCTHFILAMEIARSGVGVALIPDFLAAPELARGGLVRVGDGSVPSGRTYRLSFKSARRKDAEIDTLVRWFREQTRPARGDSRDS